MEVIFTAAVLKQKEEKSSMHLIKNDFRIGEQGRTVPTCVLHAFVTCIVAAG